MLPWKFWSLKIIEIQNFQKVYDKKLQYLENLFL